MPTYDYVCRECGKEFEITIRMQDYDSKSTPNCHECGSKDTSRMFQALNILGRSRGNSKANPPCCPGGGCCG